MTANIEKTSQIENLMLLPSHDSAAMLLTCQYIRVLIPVKHAGSMPERING